MSAVVDQTAYSIDPTAESTSVSQDDLIGDLISPTVDLLYPSKKTKMIEGESTHTEMEKEKEKEKEEKVYHTAMGCRCCKVLATREFVAMPDDSEYGCDHLKDDEGLRLRVINYLRSLYVTGGFEVECLPDGIFGGIYHRDHFPYPNFDDNAIVSAQACITAYNNKGKEPKNLEFKQITNICALLAAQMVYYLTFEALDPEKEDDDKTETYHAVVAHSWLKSSVTHIFVFRRTSDYLDLLDPHPDYAEKTLPASHFHGNDSEEDSEEEDSE
ncbi:hypothetical protein LINGRAHAP2_LOCUS12174 [Linum grandiflorum]